MLNIFSESAMKLPRIQNMRSINRYMMGTGYPKGTAGNLSRNAMNYEEAAKIKDDWVRWYGDIGWWEFRFDDAIYDEARNRLQAFDRASAKSKKELESVVNRQLTGMTSEEMEGKPRRNLSDGSYYVPWVSSYTKTKWTTLGLLGGGLVSLFLTRDIVKAVKK